MNRGSLLALAMVTSAGCATAAKDAPVLARFDERGMTGQDIALARVADGIQGKAFGRDVALSWATGEVQGRYDGSKVALAPVAAGEGVEVRGEFHFGPASFWYSPQRLEGMLDGCRFRVDGDGTGSYAGMRQCPGEKARPLSVKVPAELWTRPEGERAAWMALLVTDHRATHSVAGGLISFGVVPDPTRTVRNRGCGSEMLQ